jgi:hypothetical protein
MLVDLKEVLIIHVIAVYHDHVETRNSLVCLSVSYASWKYIMASCKKAASLLTSITKQRVDTMCIRCSDCEVLREDCVLHTHPRSNIHGITIYRNNIY